MVAIWSTSIYEDRRGRRTYPVAVAKSFCCRQARANAEMARQHRGDRRNADASRNANGDYTSAGVPHTESALVESTRLSAEVQTPRRLLYAIL